MFVGEKSQRGQVLLVVVIASVIALTVGLAAVSRTLTNTKVTTEEKNSQQALSAAEAGVEEIAGNSSLIASGITKQLTNNSGYNAKATRIAQSNPIDINGGDSIGKNEGADIWLSDYPSYANPWSGTLTLYWQRSSSTCSSSIAEAAVEVVIVYGGTTTNPSLSRYAIDRCAGSRGNNFTSTGITSSVINGTTYNTYALPAISTGYIARVIPLYQDTTVKARYSTATFPSQGYKITSTGSSGTTKRTIQVFQGFPRVPVEFFPYNLFLP